MTPRGDDPLRDFRTGAWLYVMALTALGFWLTLMEERRL